MRTLLYVRPSVAPPEVVSTFAATLRAEQLRHLDAVRRACAILDGHAGRLPALASAQGALTRQWFDAQRSLLARCAEIDAEVEQTELTDVWADEVADDVAAAQRQLAAVLDSWWEMENRRAAERLAGSATLTVEPFDEVAPLADDDCTAEAELFLAQHAITQELPVVVENVVTTALPADLLALLEDVETSGLASLLDALASTLQAEPDAAPAPKPAAASAATEPVLVVEPEPVDVIAPRDLEIRADLVDRPAPVAPSRTGRARRTRSNDAPISGSIVRGIVLPMVTTTVALGLLMAWIG